MEAAIALGGEGLHVARDFGGEAAAGAGLARRHGRPRWRARQRPSVGPLSAEPERKEVPCLASSSSPIGCRSRRRRRLAPAASRSRSAAGSSPARSGSAGAASGAPGGRTPALHEAARRHLCDHRPDRKGISRVLRRLLQRRAVAAVALPSRFPRLLSVTNMTATAPSTPISPRRCCRCCKRRRSGLGARLPADHRWAPSCASAARSTASASSSTSRSCRRRSSTRCPAASPLLRSLCAYDVVGFHIDDHKHAFLACVTTFLDVTPEEDGSFVYEGRRVQTISDPIGIDAEEFAATAARSRAWSGGPPHPRKPVQPRPGDRRRPARLFQGPAQPLPSLRPAARPLPRASRHRSPCCRSRRARARMSTATSSCAARSIGWWATSTAATRSSTGFPIRYMTRALSRKSLGGLLPRRAGRAGDAAARRHEPRRQGICRRAIERRSGRAHPVAFRGAADELRDALIVNPFRCRRGGGGDQPGADDGTCPSARNAGRRCARWSGPARRSALPRPSSPRSALNPQAGALHGDLPRRAWPQAASGGASRKPSSPRSAPRPQAGGVRSGYFRRFRQP